MRHAHKVVQVVLTAITTKEVFLQDKKPVEPLTVERNACWDQQRNRC